MKHHHHHDLWPELNRGHRGPFDLFKDVPSRPFRDITFYCVPTGIRTPVTGVKGRCPGPLDDGDLSYFGKIFYKNRRFMPYRASSSCKAMLICCCLWKCQAANASYVRILPQTPSRQNQGRRWQQNSPARASLYLINTSHPELLKNHRFSQNCFSRPDSERRHLRVCLFQ